MQRAPSADRNRLVEVTAKVEHETAKAFLLDIGKEEHVWVPKSQATETETGKFKMPEWLALKKGMI